MDISEPDFDLDAFFFFFSSTFRGPPLHLSSRRSSSALRAASSRFARSSSLLAWTASSRRRSSSCSFSLSAVLAANSLWRSLANLSTSESLASVKLSRTSFFKVSSSLRSFSTSVIPFSAAAEKSRATMPFNFNFLAVMSFCEGHGYFDSTWELASAMVLRNSFFNRNARKVFSSTYTPQSFKFSCWCTSATRARVDIFSKRTPFCGPFISHSFAR
mmetsp:Transcript_22926/g.66274  ORF Transcript_22926/g.66274 Transcript_22926/m.66274 type:complete len:216 (+) Transcript_22926:531-1178(+)